MLLGVPFFSAFGNIFSYVILVAIYLLSCFVKLWDLFPGAVRIVFKLFWFSRQAMVPLAKERPIGSNTVQCDSPGANLSVRNSPKGQLGGKMCPKVVADMLL